VKLYFIYTHAYYNVFGVCVTYRWVWINYRIYCTFIQIVTILHKSLYVFSSPSSSTAASGDSINSNSAGIGSLLYSLGAALTENIASQQFFYFHRGVVISPLHRNSSYSIFSCVFISAGTCSPNRCLIIDVCLLWFRYSSFQASCHNKYIYIYRVFHYFRA
jgi:hypothetical protein